MLTQHLLPNCFPVVTQAGADEERGGVGGVGGCLGGVRIKRGPTADSCRAEEDQHCTTVSLPKTPTHGDPLLVCVSLLSHPSGKPSYSGSGRDTKKASALHNWEEA